MTDEDAVTRLAFDLFAWPVPPTYSGPYRTTNTEGCDAQVVTHFSSHARDPIGDAGAPSASRVGSGMDVVVGDLAGNKETQQ